ncbi:DUF4167 domain-containing protein [Candidatus Pelagibacter sp.]|nr:DUF4167 domain-containing protein [Candidatus Pelagibacter sp.]
MVTFRNNNRRSNFRRNDRSFKSAGDRNKFSNSFANNDNFQRKSPGRNNHNAPKLIEKYNNLAREALSGGDKILSENYFQHADHFTRILNEQENLKKKRFNENLSSKSITQEKVDDKNTQINDNSEENPGSTSQNEMN